MTRRDTTGARAGTKTGDQRQQRQQKQKSRSDRGWPLASYRYCYYAINIIVQSVNKRRSRLKEETDHPFWSGVENCVGQQALTRTYCTEHLHHSMQYLARHILITTARVTPTPLACPHAFPENAGFFALAPILCSKQMPLQVPPPAAAAAAAATAARNDSTDT